MDLFAIRRIGAPLLLAIATARAAVAAVLFASAGLALAHPALLGSIPKADDTLDTSPREIRLRFNEPVEIAFTHVKVVDATGRALPVKAAHADPSDARTAIVPLPPLPTGSYRASWSAVGRDGHPVKGELGFSVK